MKTVYILLLTLAGLCFGAAALNFRVAGNRREINLVALGLLLWSLVPLLTLLDTE